MTLVFAIVGISLTALVVTVMVWAVTRAPKDWENK
jgi:hypothetical protein